MPAPLRLGVVTGTGLLAARAPRLAPRIGNQVDLNAHLVLRANQARLFDDKAREFLHASQKGFNRELDGGGRLMLIALNTPNEGHLPPSANPFPCSFPNGGLGAAPS